MWLNTEKWKEESIKTSQKLVVTLFHNEKLPVRWQHLQLKNEFTEPTYIFAVFSTFSWWFNLKVTTN